ncbi:hypothetical protein GGR56DRAFT_660514 [Xylariaceae sp. FL0804]|nr:hypothetical protein GGR56DRAFT_660514 [Xylariaceae sp. FL0804]
MGKELARVLYTKGAKVYVACRSEEKASETIKEVRKADENQGSSRGSLVALTLDLGDFSSVQTAVSKFRAQENKLHVVFKNAGVMVGWHSSARTTQGHEEALGVNCIGPFLFTMLLTPTLLATANSGDDLPGTVRVDWMSSFGLETFAPEGRGVDLDNLDYHVPKPGMERYGISKAGDWLLAVEYGRRHKDIVSVAINSGNIRNEFTRHQVLR